MTINAQVLRFCERNAGSRVGRGECYDLADQALREAGAKSAPDYGRITPEGDYVWGSEVRLADAQPGDVVQFRNFRVRVENADGSWREETRGAPNHTAVIKEIASGGRVTLYEQNVGGGSAARRVQTNELRLSGGRHGDATVTVHGGFRIYRPEAAASARSAPPASG